MAPSTKGREQQRQSMLIASAVFGVIGLSLLHHLILGAGPARQGSTLAINQPINQSINQHLQEATQLLDVGFLITVYKEPIGQIQQKLRLLRHFYPEAPVIVRSDGGHDYTAVCAQYDCHFLLGRRLAHTHKSWYKDVDFGYECKEFLHAIDQAVSWMNTSWFVLLEPDTMVTRAMSLPPPDLKVAALANVKITWTGTHRSEFMTWIETHEGRKLTSTWGNPGGLVETAAWKAAFRGLAGQPSREEALRVHDRCPQCVAPDECQARLFALHGQDFTHWIDFLEVGMKFPSPGVAGWDSMAEFKVWPQGTDISPCLDCLQTCSRLCPLDLDETTLSSEADKAVDCIVSDRCGLVCPALLHEVNSGGICGPDLASTAAMYRKHGDWKGEQLLCFTTGFCRPNHTVYLRYLWIFTWLLLAPSMVYWCGHLWHSAGPSKAE